MAKLNEKSDVKSTEIMSEKKEETNDITPIEQKMSESKQSEVKIDQLSKETEVKIDEKVPVQKQIEENVPVQKQIEEKAPEIKVETKAPEEPKIIEHEFKEENKVIEKKEPEIKVEEIKKEENKESRAAEVAKDLKFVSSLIGPSGSTDQST